MAALQEEYRVYWFFYTILLAVFDALFFYNLAVMLQENVWSNYSRRSPYYSGIISDSFYHLLFQKLFRHNVHMPKDLLSTLIY